MLSATKALPALAAPTADLVYHEIVPMWDPKTDMLQDDDNPQNLVFSDQYCGNSSMSSGKSPENLPPQFNGAFADHTFWDFINQGL